MTWVSLVGILYTNQHHSPNIFVVTLTIIVVRSLDSLQSSQSSFLRGFRSKSYHYQSHGSSRPNLYSRQGHSCLRLNSHIHLSQLLRSFQLLVESVLKISVALGWPLTSTILPSLKWLNNTTHRIKTVCSKRWMLQNAIPDTGIVERPTEGSPSSEYAPWQQAMTTNERQTNDPAL